MKYVPLDVALDALWFGYAADEDEDALCGKAVEGVVVSADDLAAVLDWAADWVEARQRLRTALMNPPLPHSDIEASDG